MKRFVMALIALFSLCQAQTAQNDTSRRAETNVIGAQYPRIYPDGRACFRLQVPEAQKVVVDVGGHKYDMTKSSDGAWTATSQPLLPGFHYYSISVNGVSVTDPGSETFLGVLIPFFAYSTAAGKTSGDGPFKAR